jgi:uncharacterized membrane protein (UPF0127 family)
MADSFASRLRGWMGRASVRGDEALWLMPCAAVHTLGMRFAVDLVWLDRAGRVLRIDPGVGPWRLRWCRGAHSVLELPRGGAGAQGWRPGHPVPQVGAVVWGLALCPGAVAAVLSMLLVGAGLPAQAAAPLQDEADGPIVFETTWQPDPERLAQDYAAGMVVAPVSGMALATAFPSAVGPLAGVPAALPTALPTALPSALAAAQPNPRAALPPLTLVRPLAPETLTRLLDDADSLYRGRQWTRAMEAYQGLVELDPGNRTAWLRIGNLHHQRNQLGAAAGAYRKAAQGSVPTRPPADGRPIPDSPAAPDMAETRGKALANLAAVNLELARESLAELQSLRLAPGSATAELRDAALADLRALDPAAAPSPASSADPGPPARRPLPSPDANLSQRWPPPPVSTGARATVEYLREAPAQPLGASRDRTVGGR